MRSYLELIELARREVETLPMAAALELFRSGEALWIDLREGEERAQHGWIPDAVHVPRGELEFYFDPSCPYHLPELAADRCKILYCAGAWRSALAAQTLKQLGYSGIAHLEGGFTAWVASGGKVVHGTTG